MPNPFSVYQLVTVTPEVRGKVRRLYDAGHTPAAIGRALGVGAHTPKRLLTEDSIRLGIAVKVMNLDESTLPPVPAVKDTDTTEARAHMAYLYSVMRLTQDDVVSLTGLSNWSVRGIGEGKIPMAPAADVAAILSVPTTDDEYIDEGVLRDLMDRKENTALPIHLRRIYARALYGKGRPRREIETLLGSSWRAVIKWTGDLADNAEERQAYLAVRSGIVRSKPGRWVRDYPDVPMDDDVLATAESGRPVNLPHAEKASYARELYRRGLSITAIKKVLRSSINTVSWWVRDVNPPEPERPSLLEIHTFEEGDGPTVVNDDLLERLLGGERLPDLDHKPEYARELVLAGRSVRQASRVLGVPLNIVIDEWGIIE